MTEVTWNGFRRIDFLFEDREALLILPDKPNAERNWLLKTEYFDAFPNFEIEMVKRGWHLAFIENRSIWCLEEDLDLKKRFVSHICTVYGLYPKCIPVGMSCGGLFAVKLAAKYPECVCALYLDAPVMNLLSCPAALGVSRDYCMEEFTADTGMTLVDLISYREHPIDKMPLLLRNRIPVFMVYGDMDDIVPYNENGALLEHFYRQNHGIIQTVCKKGCGHHPHGLEDNSALIAFAQTYSK